MTEPESEPSVYIISKLKVYTSVEEGTLVFVIVLLELPIGKCQKNVFLHGKRSFVIFYLLRIKRIFS